MTHADALGSDLLTVVARLNRYATQQAELTLPSAQARLLAQIEERGTSRICQLATADHCSQPTMTTSVQRLQAGGWVSRLPDPADARAVLVSITPMGTGALEATRAARGAVIAPHLATLDPADRTTLEAAVTILRRLLADAATTDAATTDASTTDQHQE